MASVYDDILDGVVTDIEGLSLTDITAANVIKCKISRPHKKIVDGSGPWSLVSPFGSVQRSNWSNLKDHLVYPVLVAFVAANANDPTTNITRHTEWLQKTSRVFRPRGGTVAPSEASALLWSCEVAPRGTYDLPAWFESYDIGDLLLRFHVIESRFN